MKAEATITVDGQPLTVGQSMAVRMALTEVRLGQQLKMQQVGSFAFEYRKRVDEVLTMIIKELERDRAD